jgi:hypothetical protein
VAQHDGAQPAPDVGVERAQRELLAGRGDPEEAVPPDKPHVDAGDAALKRAPPLSRCELADLLSGVALGALGEQNLDGPGLRIEPQPEAEEWRSSGRATADLSWLIFRRKRRPMNRSRLAITRSPARSLRT